MVNGKIIKDQGKELKIGLMEQNIKEIGLTGKCTGRGATTGEMETYIKEISKMEINMAKVF